MDIRTNGFLSIEQLADRYLTQGTVQTEQRDNGELTCNEVLERKSTGDQEGLKFSKHAVGRLADRNIQLTREQLMRLNDGARKAEQKGIKDSLVMIDDMAFIVNVPSRTVITALEAGNENVFTNINGAVIA